MQTLSQKGMLVYNLQLIFILWEAGVVG